MEIAQKYKEQLQRKMLDVWYNDKYKYWNADTFFSEFKVSEDSWNMHQFVCVGGMEGPDELVGYIGYSINRRTNNCHSLSAINFSDYKSDKTTFGLTLGRVVCDIFEKFHFNKLNFSVIVGNPIEESYDKMIEKYGGRIVGYFRDEVKLHDGTYCDEKLYEITSEQYFNNK